MTINERIIEIRKNENLNQVQFAKKLNLTKQTISNYETGSRAPSLDIILNIADIFNVSTDYLLGRSDYKTIEAQKLSTSNIFSTEAVNSLSDYNKKKLKLLNLLLSIDSFENLLDLFYDYQNLSKEVIDAYGKILFRSNSELKMTSEQAILYVKKSYMESPFKKVIGEILNELDSLDFDKNEELGKEKMKKSEVY